MERLDVGDSARGAGSLGGLCLTVLLAVCLLTGTPAAAQIYPRGDEIGYWFYFSTRATVERPLIGIGYVAVPDHGEVEGDLAMDAQPHRRSTVFGVGGMKTSPGKMNIILSVCPGYGVEACSVGGPKVMKGALTIQAPEESARTTWTGTLHVIDKQALKNHLGSEALKQAGLSTLPDSLDLQMICFDNLPVGLGEVGLDPVLAKATWIPKRDTEARQWLKANGIEFSQDEKWVRIWLPPFEQNLTVYRMLRSGIFDAVARDIVGAGPEQAYGVICMQSAVFKHPPQSADGVRDGLAFARNFISALASLPRFKGARFSEPVVVRTHHLEFSIIGPGSSIPGGHRDYWQHVVLSLFYYREFGQSTDEITIDLSVTQSEKAKAPPHSEPPAERFESAPDEESWPLLKAIGTELGTCVNALHQGLLYGG